MVIKSPIVQRFFQIQFKTEKRKIFTLPEYQEKRSRMAGFHAGHPSSCRREAAEIIMA
jgi:hypothetical protein